MARRPTKAKPTTVLAGHYRFAKAGRQVISFLNRTWHFLIFPAALISFFWDIIIGKRFFWEDIVEQFYPARTFLATSLRHLKLPYWSPYAFSGFPFINDVQTQTFYPLNWPLAFCLRENGRLNFLALELQIILHILIAGYLMYWLMREWRVSRWGATFAGLVFVLSGYMLTNTIHLVVIFTIAWFPLILLFLHRALYRQKAYYALAGGLVFGIAALGGYPQTLLHIAYALALYCLFYLLGLGGAGESLIRRLGRTVLALGLVLGVGIGIAAVQYLPSYFYLAHTSRSVITYKELVDASVKPVQLLTIVIPKLFGSMIGRDAGTRIRTDSVNFWLNTYDYQYWETVLYFGVLPLVLAFFGIGARRQPLRFYALALALIALVLALGHYTPVYDFALKILPGFNKFRIPGRLNDLFTFAMALLAGLGLDGLVSRSEGRGTRWLLRGLIIGLVLCLAGWLMILSGVFRNISPETRDPNNYANMARQTGIALLFLVTALAIVIIRRLLGRRGAGLSSWRLAVVVALILSVTFVDMYLFGHRFIGTTLNPDKHPFVTGEAVDFLKRETKKRAFRVNSRDKETGLIRLMGRNQGNLDRIELIEGYTPLGLARYAPFLVPSQRMLDLLNVAYEVDTSGRALTLNRQYLPRARMAYQYKVVDSDSAALRMILDSVFDYRQVAILETDPGIPVLAQDTQAIKNNVREVLREPNVLKYDIQTEAAGILILSEVYYPEWKARIDGKPVPIYPVDFVLRGVTVPAGAHRVEMYYDGANVRTGGIISLATLLLSVGLIVLLRRKTRNQKKERQSNLTLS